MFLIYPEGGYMTVEDSTYCDLFSEAHRAITDPALEVPEEITPLFTRNDLRGLPSHTLMYLNSLAAATPDSYLMCIIISALHENAPASVIDDLAYLYSNMNRNHFSPEVYAAWDNNKGFEGFTILGTTLRGCAVSTLDGMDYQYGSHRPMRLQEDGTGPKVVALFNTINALVQKGPSKAVTMDAKNEAEYLADTRLAQLVIDRHEHNAELIEVMEIRDTVDPDIIGMVLDADAPALGSGVL